MNQHGRISRIYCKVKKKKTQGIDQYLLYTTFCNNRFLHYPPPKPFLRHFFPNCHHYEILISCLISLCAVCILYICDLDIRRVRIFHF